MTDDLYTLITEALHEDLPEGDITTSFFVSQDAPTRAKIIAKASGIFYGEAIILGVLEHVDPKAQVQLMSQDGGSLNPGDIVCEIRSTMHALLKAERVLLNLLQRLCGIATLTQRFVKALDNPNIDVLDTRKTTPLLRFLEKNAVVAGGGKNHRQNLSEMVLLKENHLASLDTLGHLGDLGRLIRNFKSTHPGILVEIEIETLDQLRDLDWKDADIIMFDNFSIPDLQTGIERCKALGYAGQLEVSGTITLETIGKYRTIEIHRISVGSLTHSAKALDLSMLIL